MIPVYLQYPRKVCSAVTVFTVLLKAPHTVSCNPHTNGRRQLLVSSFFAEEITRLKDTIPSHQGQDRHIQPCTNLPPAAEAPVAKSLTTVLRTETVIAGFLTGTKAHSPLITDFITLEPGSLGGKIAGCWSLPFQKEASCRERRDCQPL